MYYCYSGAVYDSEPCDYWWGLLGEQHAAVYESLKSDPNYKEDTPPLLKISAIRLVRKQKIAVGALDSIASDIEHGQITTEETSNQFDAFYERSH